MSGVEALRRKPRLHPRVGAVRHRLRQALEEFGPAPAAADSAEAPLLLVACSGGPDSLALAITAEFFNRPARNGVRPYRVGAVVVDHGLQSGSAEVAEGARLQLEALGLAPVQVRRVSVESAGMGPEAAARTARYAALDAAAEEFGAAAVLLGHTLDDQAEQVLLGLGRGSGTRSLAGMPVKRGQYLRPFLALRRRDTEEVCALAGLQPWHDPSNTDPRFMRSRIRTRVMPFLEDEMGPGVAEALWRRGAVAFGSDPGRGCGVPAGAGGRRIPPREARYAGRTGVAARRHGTAPGRHETPRDRFGRRGVGRRESQL